MKSLSSSRVCRPGRHNEMQSVTEEPRIDNWSSWRFKPTDDENDRNRIEEFYLGGFILFYFFPFLSSETITRSLSSARTELAHDQGSPDSARRSTDSLGGNQRSSNNLIAAGLFRCPAYATARSPLSGVWIGNQFESNMMLIASAYLISRPNKPLLDSAGLSRMSLPSSRNR